jgi:hypothetical protein
MVVTLGPCKLLTSGFAIHLANPRTARVRVLLTQILLTIRADPMSLNFVTKWTAVMGALASLMVFLLVGLAVTTGVSQEYFEGFHPIPEYTEKLVAAAPILRVDFALDNVFILAYGSFFVGLAIVLRQSADRNLVNLGLAFMLGVALLDMAENHHIMSMADIAVQGLAPSEGEVRFQMVLSLMKFHLSCLGALLLALAFPRNTARGRWCAGLLFAYAFFGIPVLTAPPQWLDLLALIRTIFFVVSFLVVSWMLWGYGKPESETP